MIQPIGIAIVVMFIFLTMISFYFSAKVIYPDVIPSEKTKEMEIQSEKINLSEFDSWKKEEIQVPSPFGYSLFGLFLPFEDSKKTVIIAHGITYSLYGSVKYVKLFRSRGFNVLIYDHRNHGRSGGNNTTFGFYEKHDLNAVIHWVRLRVGQESIIGTMGESMGAAIVIQNAAIQPDLQFVIADCPFSDLMQLLAYRARIEYHLPAFPILYMASWASYLLSGFKFQFVSPIKDMSASHSPILIIHGKADTYIPQDMSIQMANVRRPALTQIYLAPNSGHAESIIKNPEEYDRVVGDFLSQIKIPLNHQ